MAPQLRSRTRHRQKSALFRKLLPCPSQAHPPAPTTRHKEAGDAGASPGPKGGGYQARHVLAWQLIIIRPHGYASVTKKSHHSDTPRGATPPAIPRACSPAAAAPQQAPGNRATGACNKLPNHTRPPPNPLLPLEHAGNPARQSNRTGTPGQQHSRTPSRGRNPARGQPQPPANHPWPYDTPQPQRAGTHHSSTPAHASPHGASP